MSNHTLNLKLTALDALTSALENLSGPDREFAESDEPEMANLREAILAICATIDRDSLGRVDLERFGYAYMTACS